MPSCFVCNRSRTSTSKLHNITFHKFPTNTLVREKWYNFVTENGLNVNNINKNTLLCSSHFDPSLFVLRKNYRKLSKVGIPNVKVHRVKYAKKVHPEYSTVCQMSSTLPLILDAEKLLDKSPTNELSNISCENSSLQLSSNLIDSEKLAISSKELLKSKVSVQSSNLAAANSISTEDI